MADDLDPQLRGAMKTLDDEVPSGYFDGLPERLLARLARGGEAAMQQTGTPDREPHLAMTALDGTAPPFGAAAGRGSPPVDDPHLTAPAGAPREEDSGLHDIRSLAQSTRQRVSKRMTTSPPPMRDDDVLSGASASWKNLALPQPAKMVALPEIESLPSKAELKAAQKTAKADAIQARGTSASPVAAVAPVRPSVGAAVAPVSASGAVAYPAPFSRVQQQPRSTKGRTIAIVGVLVAAAAGAAVFVATQQSGDKAAPQIVAQRGGSPDLGLDKDKMNKLDEATAKLEADHRAALAAAEAPPVVAAVPAAGGDGTAIEQAKAAEKAPATAKVAVHGKSVATKGGKADVSGATAEVPGGAKPETKKAAGGEQDPSFDALLKEAGVKDKKEVAKLDKKALSGDEFKKGMAAITAKAQACYKGTQGSASVKLTIAPSGQVSKVTISGPFAGKPEADCVSAAVKGASFPAWDGGPQSFGYPILLSE